MRVFVKAKPNSYEDKLEVVDQQNFIVEVREVPENSKANFAIIKVLANYYDIPKTNIKLVSGHTSKHKVFEITKD